MRLPSRRSDDADVIRARLRVLLDEGRRADGWLPDELDEPHELDGADGSPVMGRPAWAGDGGSESSDTDVAAEGQGLPAGVGRHRAPGPTPRWDPGRYGARSLWIAGLLAALLLIAWTWLERPRVTPVPAGLPAGASAGASTGASAGGSPRVTTHKSSPATMSAPPVGVASNTSATVVVSVIGLVARPGLVTLPTGARVAQAVEAAGGLLPEADSASINLAAVISDGEQVAVGRPGAGAAAGAPAGSGSTGAPTGGPVNLNTAGVADLDALPGIGPVLAQRIVDYRTQEGPFRSVEQLDDVPGIGPAIAAALAKRVTV